MSWIDDVHYFWFSEMPPEKWFSVDISVDDAIRTRFGDLYAAMKFAPPDPASLDARGHLSAVIVFDQFPRNLFRHTAQAFATDNLALGMSRDAVERGLDAGLSPHERQFLCMPFMHCEDRAMQARALDLFTEIGLADALKSGQEHKAIIDRFGRFPFRNQALGRETTPEEEAFLKTKTRWP